ncbi:unnamed protein product [Peniophora sp. CBMAI 1063]|nr:unnamed protein product [Peniophora sp. CBMAI 1063]
MARTKQTAAVMRARLQSAAARKSTGGMAPRGLSSVIKSMPDETARELEYLHRMRDLRDATKLVMIVCGLEDRKMKKDR